MTESPEHEAQTGTKLLAARSVKARLAAASGLVLVAGVALAPQAVPTTLSTPQERPAPLLGEQLQREEAPPDDLLQHIRDAVGRVGPQSVAIPAPVHLSDGIVNDFAPPGTRAAPAGFGVIVSPQYVLTHVDALAGAPVRSVVAADGATLTARLAVYEPFTGLVLMEVFGLEGPTAPFAEEPPHVGELVVAGSRWEGRSRATPAFITAVQSGRLGLGTMHGGVLPGTPVYALDGQLLALASDDGRNAYLVREAADRLTARAMAGSSAVSIGLSLQGLAGTLVEVFGDQGALVADVVAGGPADAAGLRPGDVLLAVGDADIFSPEAARLALNALPVGGAISVRAQRAGRALALEVTPAPAYEVAAISAAGLADDDGGLPVGSLFAGDRLAQLGIAARSLVVEVNGRRVTSRQQAEQALQQRRQPSVLWLRDGRTRYFVAIEPAS